MNEVTPENLKFKWFDEMQTRFSESTLNLTSAPVLLHHYYSKPFAVCTDVSSTAVGSVLSQANNNGLDPLIYYGSRALTSAESSYFALEREALDVISTLKIYIIY